MEAFTKLRRHEWWQRYSDVLITDDQHGNIINLFDPTDPWPGSVTQLRTVIYRAAQMKRLRVETELRDSGALLFVRCYTPQQAAQSPGSAVRSARPGFELPGPWDLCDCGAWKDLPDGEDLRAFPHQPDCLIKSKPLPQGQEPGY